MALDVELVDFVMSIRDGHIKDLNAQSYSVGLVSDRAIIDVNRLTGVDVTGYRHILKGSAVKHIEDRHGINGNRDGQVLDAAQTPKPHVRNEFAAIPVISNVNGQGEPTGTERARISDSAVYTSETPIVENLLSRNKIRRMPNAETSRLDVRNASAATAFTNKIQQFSENVNTTNENNFVTCDKGGFVARLIYVVIALTLAAAIFAAPAYAGGRDPFPLGHAMMSQGAIVETEGVSGREPWVSAAYYRDTLRWGASVAAVSYHGGGSASQYAVGGFVLAGPIVGKASLTQLDGLRVYYEQTAALSVGTSWRSLSFGVDAHFFRAGLYNNSADARATAAFGAAVLLRANRLTADIAAQNIPVVTTGIAGIDPLPVITARVSAVRNRYGSQGAMVKFTPSDASSLRFIIAQEYRISPAFALSASIASNPTMIGFGLTVDRSGVTGSTAVVNHPFLGWSKGVSADFAR